MPDISKISLSDTVYNIKDSVARAGVMPFCVTSGGTTAYTASVSGVTLTPGTLLSCKFNSTNAANATLNVNNLGAIPIYYKGTKITASVIPANYVVILVYETSTLSTGCWNLIWSYGNDSNTIPTGYCTTSADTAAKVASCSSFVLTSNTYLPVLFSTANSYAGGITLNVNGTGAKPIYINGVASSTTNYTLPAGTYLAYYNGTYYSIRTDGKIPGYEKIIYEPVSEGTSGQVLTTDGNGGRTWTTVSGGAPTNNPVFTGSISMGRKSGTAVGSNSTALGTSATASKQNSFSSGNSTVASGDNSHAEGSNTEASGSTAHAEGYNTTASGLQSHAEGSFTTASEQGSHAEGSSTRASSSGAHAEGQSTIASNTAAHAEGYKTTASGWRSHAENNETTASGSFSHAEGTKTIASKENQHVSGKYNIADTTVEHAVIVGNGTAEQTRSNAYTLDWNGKGEFASDVVANAFGSAPISLVNLSTSKINEPTAEGTSGQVLTTDGNGGRTWTTVSSPTLKTGDIDFSYADSSFDRIVFKNCCQYGNVVNVSGRVVLKTLTNNVSGYLMIGKLTGLSKPKSDYAYGTGIVLKKSGYNVGIGSVTVSSDSYIVYTGTISTTDESIEFSVTYVVS